MRVSIALSENADKLALAKSSIRLENLTHVAVTMDAYLSSSPATILFTFFNSMEMPALRTATLLFSNPILKTAPDEHYVVFALRNCFHHSEYKLDCPIIPPPIANALKQFTVRFRARARVVVNGGAAFLRLLGHAAHPTTLCVEANGFAVEFEDAESTRSPYVLPTPPVVYACTIGQTQMSRRS
jgi:hypothetical protein